MDDPSGDGDLELFGLPGSAGCGSESVLNQVQTVSGTPHDQTNEVVHLNACFGFMCLRKENNGSCSDYQFRQCCPNRCKYFFLSLRNNFEYLIFFSLDDYLNIVAKKLILYILVKL
jgi:hypothetical protein